MTILIWDNDEEYSSHGIYFIDIDGWDVATIEKAAAAIGKYPFRGFVLGTTERIDWRDDSNQTLWGFFGPCNVLDALEGSYDEGEEYCAETSFPREFLEWLVVKWKEQANQDKLKPRDYQFHWMRQVDAWREKNPIERKDK